MQFISITFRVAVAWGVLIPFVPSALALEPMAALPLNIRLGFPPPAIDPIDQTDLMKIARRVLVGAARGEPLYQPSYVPSSLQQLVCRVSVTLRDSGHLLATSDSETLPVVEGVRQAMAVAVKEWRAGDKKVNAVLDDIGIELELIGEREKIGTGNDTATAMSQVFEPAVHGVAARVGDREIRVRASQIISREVLCERGEEIDYRCDRYEAVLTDLQQKLGLLREPPERDRKSVILLWLRSTRAYQRMTEEPVTHVVAGER